MSWEVVFYVLGDRSIVELWVVIFFFNCIYKFFVLILVVIIDVGRLIRRIV